MKVFLLLAFCALAAEARPLESDCAQCLQIVKYIDTKLTGNATEKEIENFIDKICNDLGSAAAECKSYVSQYVPEVIKMVAGKIQPQEICQELHLCNKTRNELFLGPGPVIGGTGLDLGFDNKGKKPLMPSEIDLDKLAETRPEGEGCVICEFVVKELQTLISQNATEQEIEQALDKVCDILPSTIRTPCEQFVNQYAPQLIQLLLQKLDPQTICTTLGLCNSTRLHEPSRTFLQEPGRETDGPLCPVCEQVMKYVDSMLASNATEEEIIQTLERICHYLPQADQTECKTLIDTEGPEILKMLVQDLQPQAICTKLRLCSSGGKPIKARHA